MNILITNDDGIAADGMMSLENYLRACPEVSKVVAVAPVACRSCCGHSVNTTDAFRFHEIGPDRFAVESWPADCVRIAISKLGIKPDLVLSGINHGGNLGVDIWMSGTCSAAREATWMGFPAIAISQYRRPDIVTDWHVSAQRAWSTVREIQRWNRENSRRGFWNINLPAVAPDMTIPSIVECDPDPSPHRFEFEINEDDSWNYRGNYHKRPRIAGSDIDVCFRGNTSISFCAV